MELYRKQVKWLQVEAEEAATTCCVLLATHREEQRGETEGARDIFTPRGGVVGRDFSFVFKEEGVNGSEGSNKT